MVRLTLVSCMRHRRRSASSGLPVPFTMLVVGFWAVVLGLVFVYVALDLMEVVETSIAGSETAVFSAMLFDPLVLIYEGGVVTLGVGGVLMLFGGVLVAVGS